MKTHVSESQKQKIKKECHKLWVEYGLLPGRLEEMVYQKIESSLPIPTSFVPDAYIDKCIGFGSSAYASRCITYRSASRLRL